MMVAFLLLICRPIYHNLPKIVLICEHKYYYTEEIYYIKNRYISCLNRTFNKGLDEWYNSTSEGGPVNGFLFVHKLPISKSFGL